MTLHVLKPLPPTPANRAKLAQLEARAAAAEHIEALTEALETAARLCEEVSDGGDCYPVGCREIGRTLGDTLSQKAVSLRAVCARAGR